MVEGRYEKLTASTGVTGSAPRVLLGVKHSRTRPHRLVQEEALCVACGCLRGISGWFTNSPLAELGPVRSQCF